MESKEFVIYRQGCTLYRVPKHLSETHEQAFQRAILLSKLEKTQMTDAVKWSVASAQQLKNNMGSNIQKNWNLS